MYHKSVLKDVYREGGGGGGEEGSGNPVTQPQSDIERKQVYIH